MRNVRSAWQAGRLAAVVGTAVVGTAALVTAVTACGPSSSSSSPSASSSAAAPSSPTASSSPTTAAATDSCDVVTEAEASTALGQQVKPPILGKAVVEGGVACVFYGPEVPPGTSPDVAVGDSVRVVLVTGPHAKKWFDNYRGKVHAKPISGLGDAAYYDGYASISVLKGDAYVRIAVGIANNLQPEITLAKDALPRM